ncbi:MAG: YybH family protein [Merdibacter sp.]
MNQEIAERIHAADLAIREERYDDLMQFYCEDAVLVIRPGKTAIGKAAIREAFVKIAAYFQNSIVPTQGRMEMLEAGDTVLVLSQTFLDADNRAQVDVSMERRSTYVFRRIEGEWLCAIDNSYGTALLEEPHV